MNVVNQLRQLQLQQSTQAFKARGSQITRCDQCLQAKAYCLCTWQLYLQSSIDFILLMHPKEPYKTSNTGRLIAAMFPDNTEAFMWSRTDLPARFFDMLEDSNRHPVLLYPPNDSQLAPTNIVPSKKKTTVIILDGTWKQAARMAKLSPYLQNIPRVSLDINGVQSFDYLRQSQHKAQLSTAQAAACLLNQAGEKANGFALAHYATLLNHHTRCARENKPIEPITSHQYLHERKKS